MVQNPKAAVVKAFLEELAKHDAEVLAIIKDPVKVPAAPSVAELRPSTWSASILGAAGAPPAPPPAPAAPPTPPPVDRTPTPAPPQAPAAFALGQRVLVFGSAPGTITGLPASPGGLYAVGLDNGALVMAPATSLEPIVQPPGGLTSRL